MEVVHLRHADFRELAQSFEREFHRAFRRCWVQYSNNKSHVTVVVTLFPNGHGNYQMFFLREVRNFSYENIRSLLLNQMERSNSDLSNRVLNLLAAEFVASL